MIYRQLQYGDQERFPVAMTTHGFLLLEPEWCWVAEDESGALVALLVCSHVHGMLMVWRLLSDGPELNNWCFSLLRKAIDTARERGCIGVMSFLDESPTGRKLARIIRRQGGSELPFRGTLTAATLKRRF